MKHPRSLSTSASISLQLPMKSTKPSRLAAAASITSPVQKSQLHVAGDNRFDAATLTIPGRAPRRISGKANVAAECARTKVPIQGNAIPPPRVAPWQTTILGIMDSCIFSNCWLKASKSSRKSPVSRRCGVTSAPVQKSCSLLVPSISNNAFSGQSRTSPVNLCGTHKVCTHGAENG
eukprot:scaffold32639_cov112-Isochrysis_galbana.AAC.8